MTCNHENSISTCIRSIYSTIHGHYLECKECHKRWLPEKCEEKCPHTFKDYIPTIKDGVTIWKCTRCQPKEETCGCEGFITCKNHSVDLPVTESYKEYYTKEQIDEKLKRIDYWIDLYQKGHMDFRKELLDFIDQRMRITPYPVGFNEGLHYLRKNHL
tara:strand:+ start:54 stop:527 length:474 start_codon:yes stop_codon:yes gene_type:complete